MFFYLSFLRPPPEQAHPHRPISITPQITNDLRTEYFHEDLDVYYAWVLPDPTSPSALGSVQSPAAKLTTWRETNAYKEVSVHPPKGVQEGQSWQLLLCTPFAALAGASTGPSRGNHSLRELSITVDLSTGPEAFGRQPFAVLSLPIAFSSRKVVNNSKLGKNVENKQRSIQRILKFPIAHVGNKETKVGPLKVSEHLSFDLDKVIIATHDKRLNTDNYIIKKVWDSGIALSGWLTQKWSARESPLSPLREINQRLYAINKPIVLELGQSFPRGLFVIRFKK